MKMMSALHMVERMVPIHVAPSFGRRELPPFVRVVEVVGRCSRDKLVFASREIQDELLQVQDMVRQELMCVHDNFRHELQVHNMGRQELLWVHDKVRLLDLIHAQQLHQEWLAAGFLDDSLGMGILLMMHR